MIEAPQRATLAMLRTKSFVQSNSYLSGCSNCCTNPNEVGVFPTACTGVVPHEFQCTPCLSSHELVVVQTPFLSGEERVVEQDCGREEIEVPTDAARDAGVDGTDRATEDMTDTIPVFALSEDVL